VAPRLATLGDVSLGLLAGLLGGGGLTRTCAKVGRGVPGLVAC
jgi:hypothetical protein